MVNDIYKYLTPADLTMNKMIVIVVSSIAAILLLIFLIWYFFLSESKSEGSGSHGILGETKKHSNPETGKEK